MNVVVPLCRLRLEHRELLLEAPRAVLEETRKNSRVIWELGKVSLARRPQPAWITPNEEMDGTEGS